MTHVRSNSTSNTVLTRRAALLLLVAALVLTGTAAAENPASVLNGTYRVSFTEKELLAAGATRSFAHDNYGVFTLKLKDGRYEQHLVNYVSNGCKGSYRVSGRTFTLDLNVPGCSGFVVATWTLRNRELRLRVTKSQYPGDRLLLGTKPLKKIG